MNDNNIKEITNNYEESDKFTWNYSSINPGIGGWRGLYTYYFGTYRPHTHPWEMLEYRKKPDWWEEHYDWEFKLEISAINLPSGFPVEITTAENHTLKTGDQVKFSNIKGITGLNENETYTITRHNSNNAIFRLDGTDGSDFTAQLTVSGIVVPTILDLNINSITLSDGAPISIRVTELRHRLKTGDQITISGVTKLTELNGNTYRITRPSGTAGQRNFILDDTDGINFPLIHRNSIHSDTSGKVKVIVKNTSKRDALNKALYFGLRGEPSSTNTDIRKAKNGYDWFNNVLVQSDGTLNNPIESGLIVEPSTIERSKDFVFGDWGETETLWRQSSEYKFALVEALLHFKPYFVFEYYWSLNSWISDDTEQRQRFNSETQLRQDSNEIHNQLITTGILESIDVDRGGENYSDFSKY